MFHEFFSKFPRKLDGIDEIGTRDIGRAESTGNALQLFLQRCISPAPNVIFATTFGDELA